MAYVYILIYFILLIWLYIFIIKRMKMLSHSHMVNTKLELLWRWYEIIKRRLIIIMILMFIISSFLILTFMNNGLFQKIWLHDNKETLDIPTF